MSFVTGWNLTGVRWRDCSLVELLWLIHSNVLNNLKEERPQQVRSYLTEVKDYAALREWDNSRMKDNSDK